MSMRPVSARWFEMLTTRDDLTTALETLASTGSIELETQSGTDSRFNMPDLQQRMEEYNSLSRRYHAYWPEIKLDSSSAPGSPVRMVDRALGRLRAWAHEAAPVVHEIETRLGEQSELMLTAEMLKEQDDTNLDYKLLANAGPVISQRVFELPSNTDVKT